MSPTVLWLDPERHNKVWEEECRIHRLFPVPFKHVARLDAPDRETKRYVLRVLSRVRLQARRMGMAMSWSPHMRPDSPLDVGGIGYFSRTPEASRICVAFNTLHENAASVAVHELGHAILWRNSPSSLRWPVEEQEHNAWTVGHVWLTNTVKLRTPKGFWELKAAALKTYEERWEARTEQWGELYTYKYGRLVPYRGHTDNE